MKRATLCSFGILVILVLAMSPGSDGGRRKILMAKKLAALLLLNKKRYIFVAPFPLPVPLPVITKVKHIIHKEKVPVPVPVPVHHQVTKYVAVPVPTPEKSWPEDSWKMPEAASEISYKVTEKRHRPKNLDNIYSESSHNLKYAEKPTYSETPIKISEKSFLDSYKLHDKSYLEESDKLPERLYSEEHMKFDLKPYGSSAEESYELPKKFDIKHLDESYKFNENSYSEDLLSKLTGDLSSVNHGSTDYLGEASELSESYPMLSEGSLTVKKKK
ncbi:uncharacterized protein LOC107365029 [Tetranychus urticae]|uniref:Uncharacterized protein n=1 Tax=Tetranychus urticae TaxID=32264 RepID=T1KKC7_TETUR|nr:uncharacterized protein LOC107365029 [Tetranychus urticae]XP_015787983.1 uncharacterized protein LOC107365029 [Tetranychus urticae]XP_015787984.1 uncharacterized protein LOC107365029 [Tetranychus urticae]XP_025017167.1 uncharacterized protein LOC107365029 [Tetranychus urticae]